MTPIFTLAPGFRKARYADVPVGIPRCADVPVRIPRYGTLGRMLPCV